MNFVQAQKTIYLFIFSVSLHEIINISARRTNLAVLQIHYARHPIMKENIFFYFHIYRICCCCCCCLGFFVPLELFARIETTLLSMKDFICFTYTKHSRVLRSERYSACHNYRHTRFCLFWSSSVWIMLDLSIVAM